MQKVDPTRIEMIRSREQAGFCFLNKSFLAEKVSAVPSGPMLEGLIAHKWWDSPLTMAGFVNTHNGAPAAVATRLRVVYDQNCLLAAFIMDEPQMDKTSAFVTESGTRRIEFKSTPRGRQPDTMIPYVIEKDDAVEFMLDAGHSHRRYVRFFINLAGVHYASEEELVHHWAQVYPTTTFIQAWEKPYSAEVLKGKDFWCAAFRIPWSSLGVDPESAILAGVNARRSRTVGEWNKHILAFSPDVGACALDFADLYMGQKPLEVSEVDFGFPVFDENSFSVKLTNTSTGRLDLTCLVKLTGESTADTTLCQDQAEITLDKGQSGVVRLRYRPDERETLTQTMAVSIRQPSGKELYRGAYFLSRLSWVMIEDRYDWPGPQSNPPADDPDFVKKKRSYLLSRLPKFTRATTADGAPSDFTLRSTCGRHEFNLMRSGEAKRIADMLNELFDDADDRLAASCLLAHQRTLSTHMSQQAALHTQISPLSAMRLNAGHCYSRSLVWLAIAQHLKDRQGEAYGDRAHAHLVLGHVVGAIDAGPDDRYVFDPTYGSSFYRWDNKGFATEREIEADLTLADRVLHNRRHRFDFVQFHRAIPAGQIVWPQGAPVE